MGIVKINTEAYLTQKGRENLIKGKGNGITKFAIFDSDINYNTEIVATDITDISGDNGCVKSLSGGYEPRNFVWIGGKPTPQPKILIDNRILFDNNTYTKTGSSTEKLTIQLQEKLDYDCIIEVIITKKDKLIENIKYEGNVFIFTTQIDALNANKIKFNVKINKNQLLSSPFYINFESFNSVADKIKSSTTNFYLSDVTNTQKALETNDTNINYEIVIPDIFDFRLIKNKAIVNTLDFSLLFTENIVSSEFKTLFISNIIGGVAPYKYKLTNNSVVIKNNISISLTTQENIGSYSYGIYEATLTDNTGNTVIKQIEFAKPFSQIDFNITKIRDNNASSAKFGNGIIFVNSISGGNGIYSCDVKLSGTTKQTILLDNVDEIEITDLLDGVFNIVIRDTLGITTTKPITINKITAPQPNIVLTYDYMSNILTIQNVVKTNNDTATHTLNINGVVIPLPYFDGIYTYVNTISPNSNSGYNIIFTEYLTGRTGVYQDNLQ